MVTSQQVVVSVNVVTENPEAVTRSIEAFARAAAGLALEGLTLTVTIEASTVEVDEEAEAE